MLAPIKINLSLNITGKRNDGYHLLHSYVVFADYGDYIYLERSDEGYSLVIEGPFAHQVSIQDNIINKAAHLLSVHCNRSLNYTVRLIKNIPVGAGLGGGSSDAAAIIKILCREWGVTLPLEALKDMLLSLGADVPVCYYGMPCVMEGIGDIITPLPPNNMVLPAILIYPNTAVSTLEIFKKYNGQSYDKTPIPQEKWKNKIEGMHNDLMQVAISHVPIIQNAIDLLQGQTGCITARMSGSGSACFGIFSDEDQCNKALKAIQNDHPLWWIQSVSINI